MSTLVSSIIHDAFREGNIIAIGQTPTAAEIAEAVPQLNRYIQSLLGTELGEELSDWYIPNRLPPQSPLRSRMSSEGIENTAISGSTWQFPPQNSRLICHTTSEVVVYFPPNPSDGARMRFIDVGSTAAITLHGNGRLISGQPTIVGQPAVGPDPGPEAPHTLTGAVWVYRGDLGNWYRIDTVLISTDAVFLPPEFDDLLITGLLMRISKRFEVRVDDVTIARNLQMLQKLKTRYKQTENIPGGANDLGVYGYWPETTFMGS